jgi:hypothetical protein
MEDTEAVMETTGAVTEVTSSTGTDTVTCEED